MKRVALFVVLMSALTTLLSACNTMHGLGQDIEKAGSAIECIVRGYLSGSAWKEYRDISLKTKYADVALDSLKLHGWRMANADGGKRSKFHFIEGS